MYNTFSFEEGEDKEDVTTLLKKLSDHFMPKKNVAYERHIFTTRLQKEGETLDQYITDLRSEVSSCEFGVLAGP